MIRWIRYRYIIWVELNLSNDVAKSDLKSETGIDTSKFAKKLDLACLKLDVDKLDIDKLKTTLVDLSKISNVVKNDVVKKAEYDELVKKVNPIDTSDLIKKADYNTTIVEVEKKILTIKKRYCSRI